MIMGIDAVITESSARKTLAVKLNGRVWELLAKAERTQAEQDEMIGSAHASLLLWTEFGTLNQQRGHWLISRVYAVLKLADSALYHASRCRELTERLGAGEGKDFDRAYALEAVARALAAAGKQDEARAPRELARSAGAKIADEEDRKIFTGDLEAGPWYGLQ
jgi:hypothetical protein